MDSNTLIDYLNRLSDADTKTLSQRLTKGIAEYGELSDALLSYEGAPGGLARYTSREQIIDEIADVALCLYSIARKIEATPEELVDMIIRKANKWQGKQDATAEIKDVTRIPYEVHVSITPPKKDSANYDACRRLFSYTCKEIGVKPTILTLYGKNSEWEDWMTSSTFVGTNRQVDTYMESIVHRLRVAGLSPIRKKVETVPWHPAAKALTGCYFEKHWEIAITPEKLDELRSFARTRAGAVSRNTRKPMIDDKIIMSIENDLTEGGFVVIDSIAEYAVYDSAEGMDKDWLKDS